MLDLIEIGLFGIVGVWLLGHLWGAMKAAAKPRASKPSRLERTA